MLFSRMSLKTRLLNVKSLAHQPSTVVLIENFLKSSLRCMTTFVPRVTFPASAISNEPDLKTQITNCYICFHINWTNE